MKRTIMTDHQMDHSVVELKRRCVAANPLLAHLPVVITELVGDYIDSHWRQFVEATMTKEQLRLFASRTDLLAVLQQKPDKLSLQHAYVAARFGSCELVQWMLSLHQATRLRRAICRGAVAGNRLDVLLLVPDFKREAHLLYRVAIEEGKTPDMLAYLLKHVAHPPDLRFDVAFAKTLEKAAQKPLFFALVENRITKVWPELLRFVAIHCDLHTLQRCVAKNTEPLEPALLTAAAQSGDLSKVLWLRQQDCPWDQTFVESLSIQLSDSKADALFWFALDQHCPMDNTILNSEACLMRNHWLKELLQRGFCWDDISLAAAARYSCNIEQLDRLHAMGAKGTVGVLAAMMSWCSFADLERYRDNGFIWGASELFELHYVAQHDLMEACWDWPGVKKCIVNFPIREYLPLLQKLWYEGALPAVLLAEKLNEQFMHPCGSPDLDLLTWFLRQAPITFSAGHLEEAAAKNQSHIVSWLLRHGARSPYAIGKWCALAAAHVMSTNHSQEHIHGQEARVPAMISNWQELRDEYGGCDYALLDRQGRKMVRVLHEAGCEWTPGAMKDVVWAQCWKTLKYMVCNGCPWDMNVMCDLAYHLQWDLMRWCRERGCPWGQQVGDMLIAKQDRQLLAWAIEAGCPLV